MPSLSVLRSRLLWTRLRTGLFQHLLHRLRRHLGPHAPDGKHRVETTTADVDVHCEIAAEFLACPPKAFNKDSVCVFSTRTGTTPEIIEAAKS